jgi:ADP-ribose pyrophosphatase YjhB (NUDIX family)
MTRDSFCSYCGTAFELPLAYPRTCAKCKTTIWANPIPVAVALVPITRGDRTGLLVVRRGIEPGKGKLALVGGFVEENETWQVGAPREVREEVGIELDASRIEPFYFVSTEPRPNRVLLFAIAPAIDERALEPFVPNAETMERAVLFAEDGFADFAFPLHAEAARRFFSGGTSSRK